MGASQKMPVESGQYSTQVLNYRLLRIASDSYGVTPDQLSDEQSHAVEQQAARELVIEQAVLRSPEARDVVVPESQVELAFARVRERFDDADAFADTLAHNGMTETSLTKALEQELKVEAVLDVVCRSVGEVTDTELELFFYLHRERFEQPEKRVARHILITVNETIPENERANALARIEAIAARLQKHPHRFEEQALKHSECPSSLNGGLLGTMPRGTLFPEIDVVLFGLKAGQVSDVIETEVGFHVVLCESVIPAKALTLSDVKAELAEQLNQRNRSQYRKRWLLQLMRDEQARQSEQTRLHS